MQPGKPPVKIAPRSERFKNVAIGIAGLISSIAIPAVGLWLGYLQKEKEVSLAKTQKSQEIEKSYIELGIRILSDAPTPESEALRKWAVKLVNAHTVIKLDGAAASAVVNEVPLSESSAEEQKGLALYRLHNAVITRRNPRVHIDYDGVGGRDMDRAYGHNLTSLRYKDGASLDSRKVPYLAIPSSNVVNGSIRYGDYAVVFDASTGNRAFAVVGDAAPNRNAIGISVALANALAIPYDGRDLKGDHLLVSVIFVDSADDKWPEALTERATALYESWGGDAAIEEYLQLKIRKERGPAEEAKR